jgi:hypothetical protein
MELRRNDVQPFAEVFADDMTFMPTGTGRAVRFNNHFDAWKVFGQSPAWLAFFWRTDGCCTFVGVNLCLYQRDTCFNIFEG